MNAPPAALSTPAHSYRLFTRLFDRYYWQTAVLIAKNGLARQYRNSFLGILWTLVQPLIMVMVYTTIMPMILRSSGNNYRLYIVVSLPLWGFFSSALIGSSQSILANGEVLKRCMISSTVFPIADVLRHTYTLCVSFIAMNVVAQPIFGTLSPTLLLVPVFFVPVLMITGAACISIAFIAPYIRDIGEFVILTMTIMFWLTPVVYDPSILPPRALAMMQWNPFYIMMHPLQMVAFEHVVPDTGSILRLLALTLVAIFVGFNIFNLCRRNYVYYL